jgi:enoyl-[acyl-carrier protein] reductase I
VGREPSDRLGASEGRFDATVAPTESAPHRWPPPTPNRHTFLYRARRVRVARRKALDSAFMLRRFDGKRALVLGVANRRSIAWAVARRLAAEGAVVAVGFRRDRGKKAAQELAEDIGGIVVGPCDVRSDADIDRTFSEVARSFSGSLDVMVHSIAFANLEDLDGRFIDTSRESFWLALEVSAYSIVACCRAAEPLMDAAGGGSVVTMTYLGGERAFPGYNVMGVAKATLDSAVQYLAWDLGAKNIRINALSPGPVRTLAARAVPAFLTFESLTQERSPLHKAISADNVADSAAYLLSDDASAVTATTLYVDSGYHSMGM